MTGEKSLCFGSSLLVSSYLNDSFGYTHMFTSHCGGNAGDLILGATPTLHLYSVNSGMRIIPGLYVK